MGRAECGGGARAAPGRSRLREPRTPRLGRVQRRRCAFGVKAHGSESSTRCAATRRCRRWGRRRSSRPRPVRRLRAHPESALRRRRRSRRSRARGAARHPTSTTGACGLATEAARRAARARRGAIRRTPGTRASGYRTKANAVERLAGVSRRRSARPSSTSGSFSTTRGVHVLLEALRDAGCPRGDRRLRRLPRGARGSSRGPNTLFTGPLEHRHLRPPAARSRTSTVVPLDLPGGVRHGRRRGRCRADLPPLVAATRACRDRRGPGAGVSGRHLRHLASFANGDAADLRAKLERAACARARARTGCARAGGPERDRQRAGAGPASRAACWNRSTLPSAHG